MTGRAENKKQGDPARRTTSIIENMKKLDKEFKNLLGNLNSRQAGPLFFVCTAVRMSATNESLDRFELFEATC